MDQSAPADHRPWGYYQVLSESKYYKVKKIVVYPGRRLSLQRHRGRAEHWYILQGEALATCGEEERKVGEGRSLDIPRGALHRLFNPGDRELILVEIQTGDYFGEDDIERIEDDYGRV